MSVAAGAAAGMQGGAAGSAGDQPQACRNATAEACDGVDNDCDGKIDEGVTSACGSEIGVCTKGSRQCRAGQWDNACQGGVRPSAEICDAERRDEDCDGISNEDCACVTGDTMPCGNLTPPCKQGVVNCIKGTWSARCEGQIGPSAEVCDGLDNDCDGLTDNVAGRTCVAERPAPGSLDTTFGDAGKTALPQQSNDQNISGLVLSEDGSILLAGNAALASLTLQGQYIVSSTVLTRLTSAGALDLEFGGGGVGYRIFQSSATSIEDTPLSLFEHASGKFSLAGYTRQPDATAAAHSILVSRFNADGTSDLTFNAIGHSIRSFDGTDAKACSILGDQDGALSIGGFVGGGTAVARYTNAGQPDPRFGDKPSGMWQPMLSGMGAACSLAHAADGGLLIAVQASTFAVIRLDATGALDPSFGVGGLATIDLHGYATQLLVQPDRAIVVVGVVRAADDSEQQDIAVARLTETGQRDPSFGDNGLTRVHFANGISIASAAALAPDGSIVVAGATPRGNGMSSFSVVRVTHTGALDSTFGEAGRKLLSDGGLAQVIAVDSDARIVVAGWIEHRQCVVYRLWL